MSDEKWVTLTPEQVEALEQGVIVRAHRGDTMVQGPLDNVSAGGTCVGIGLSAWSRIYAGGSVEVRERDVPKPDPQRLVSVRADDLTDLLNGWVMQNLEEVSLPTEARVRAALRGETS